MINCALVLLPLLAAGALAGAEQISTSAAAARSVLRTCDSTDQQLASQSDRTWAAQADALQTHAKLRSELGEPMPHAASMVLVYAMGGHLATEEFSLVLERQQNGRWLGTAVGRTKIWVESAPYMPLPRKQWTLSPEVGQRLDAILQNPCLYAEPTEFEGDNTHPPPLGAMVVHLDVVTPARRRTSLFMGGDAKGLTAELVRLATPK